MKHIKQVSVAKAATTDATDIFTKVPTCVGTLVSTISGALNTVYGAFSTFFTCLFTPTS